MRVPVAASHLSSSESLRNLDSSVNLRGVHGVEDIREHYRERRWVTLGLSGMKVVVIVHTETEDEIHVISMREADNDEQLLFFANLR